MALRGILDNWMMTPIAPAIILHADDVIRVLEGGET
jgi:hypothetical protein